MRISTNAVLRLIYEPKKLLLSRTVLACLVISIFAIGAVYIKQRSAQRQLVQLTANDLQNLDTNYSQTLVSMQTHIAALNSRIKHLSVDNRRLSSTGHKLAEQLRNTNTNIKEKLAQTKELQLELYAVDQHLISKYDNFIEQQKGLVTLKEECDKHKDKNNMCQNYAETKQALDESIAQIKFLKNKREVLLSEIARSTTGI